MGFTSAAAIIIATSQIKDILGISIEGGKFVSVWQSIFKRIDQTRLWDTVLGVLCIIVLLLLRVRNKYVELRNNMVQNSSMTIIRIQ